MKTSEEWWNATKNDEARTRRWLIGQYRGERLAAERILALRDRFAVMRHDYSVLTAIAGQERTHALWIGDLLMLRGIDLTTVPDRPERYWPKAMEAITDLKTGCAAASHAEKMRLERIQAIVSDPESPDDIKEVFLKILPQELWHERAFRELAGSDALLQTAETHKIARKALGLA